MDRDPWTSAKTFTDLLSLNQDYLRGDRTVSPYRDRPINEETRQLQDKLLELHTYGVFTYCSKPSKRFTWMDQGGNRWEQQQKEFVCAIISSQSLIEGILERLSDFKTGLDIWVNQINPRTTIKPNVALAVVRQRKIESRAWDETIVLSNHYPSDLFEPRLDALEGRRLWSIDVASATWVSTNDVIATLRDAARSAELLRLEALPAEVIQILAGLCPYKGLASLRLSSRILCAKTDTVFQPYLKRFSCRLEDQSQMRQKVTFFADPKAHWLRSTTEVLHIILPKSVGELSSRAEAEPLYRRLEQLVLTATQSSERLRRIEVGSEVRQASTGCLAYIFLLVEQLRNMKSWHLDLTGSVTVQNLIEAYLMFREARRASHPLRYIIGSTGQPASTDSWWRILSTLDQQPDDYDLRLSSLSVALYDSQDAVNFERLASKLGHIETLTVHTFASSLTVGRVAALAKHLLANNVERLIIDGYNFDEAAFTEACVACALSMPSSKINLRSIPVSTIATIKNVWPYQYINRYMAKGESIYKSESRGYSMGRAPEERSDENQILEITGLSASTNNQSSADPGWVRIRSGTRVDHSWLPSVRFNQIARTKYRELLKSLELHQHDVLRNEFMGFVRTSAVM